MLNEILFHGWEPDLKIWLEGVYVQQSNLMLSPDFPGSVYNVDPDSVGQYIGERDKLNEKIFTGDITKLVLPGGEIRHFEVRMKTSIREVVTHPGFHPSTAKVVITGVVFIWHGFELFPCIDENGVSDVSKMEVIGTKYQSPELLEV